MELLDVFVVQIDDFVLPFRDPEIRGRVVVVVIVGGRQCRPRRRGDQMQNNNDEKKLRENADDGSLA